jgi:AcrR family transcriptional regulator
LISASDGAGSPGDALPPRSESSSAVEERRRIAETLLDLCLERGYRNIELPDLLERAEVDLGAFNRHFDDLEDCLCVIYLEVREDVFDRISRAAAAQHTWRDRVRAVAYVLLRFLREDERVTHMSVVDIRWAGERAQRLQAKAMQDLMDLLDQGRTELGDSGSISRTTAEAVGGGIFGQMFMAVERGTLSEEAVPKLMYSAILPYLGPEVAAEELSIPPPPQ